MPKTVERPIAGSLLTAAQVAEEVNCSERQVRRWMQEGWLTFVDLPRGRRVPRAALDEFLESRTRSAVR